MNEPTQQKTVHQLVSCLSGACLSMLLFIGCAQPVETSNEEGAQNQQLAGTEPVPQANAEEESGPKRADEVVGQRKGTGVMTRPVFDALNAADRLILKNVDYAVEIYKAAGNGEGPATHEEFMEKIIKANNIQLPKLPEGQRYLYDPENEQLMVEIAQ